MRREEFLRQLEMLLSDISAEERADAMEFYRSYFEDAGIGNEERILEELGSPENVAEIIKRDLGMVAVRETAGGNGTYDETKHTYTYHNGRSEYQQSEYQQSKYQQSQSGGYTMYNDSSYADDENAKRRKKYLIIGIIIAVFTFPFWIGIVSGLFGIIFGASIALIASTFAMFVVGLAFVGVGIPMIAGISGAAGVAFIGAGLIILAIAILLLNACVWIFGKFFPWAITGIVALCKKTFQKNKGAQVA